MFFNVTVCLLATAVALWVWWRKRHFSFFKDLGVPGPEPSFFFGNFLELQKEGPLACHKKWIEKYGPVVGFYLGLRPMVIVADPELLKQMEVKESNLYINRPNMFDFGVGTRKPMFSHQLIRLQGQRWKEVRKILTPAFTSGKIKMMTPSVIDSVDSLLEEMDKQDGKPFNLAPQFQSLTLDVIGKTAFGVETKIIGNTDHPLLKVVRMVFRTRLESVFFRYLLSFSELSFMTFWLIKLIFMFRHNGSSPMETVMDTCEEVIKGRRSDPSRRRPDLLQGLMDASGDIESISDNQLTATMDDNESKIEKDTTSSKKVVKLNNDEVMANALLILLAGYETTSTMLSFVVYFLINRPDIQEKVRKELEEALSTESEIGYSCIQKLTYLDQVMNESMRLCPPIYNFISRETVEETQLGGYTFPKETAFLVPVHYIQNSSKFFKNPEKFDPERFAPSRKGEFDQILWQPFGAGPRNCIGMRFAIMEAKIALAKILHRYRLEPASKTITQDLPDLLYALATIHPKGGVNVKAIKIT